MKTLNIQEIETHWTTVLLEVEEQGEQFVICRNGKPIADLFPHQFKRRIAPHPVISQIILHYDPTEPLTSEEWQEEEVCF